MKKPKECPICKSQLESSDEDSYYCGKCKTPMRRCHHCGILVNYEGDYSHIIVQELIHHEGRDLVGSHTNHNRFKYDLCDKCAQELEIWLNVKHKRYYGIE